MGDKRERNPRNWEQGENNGNVHEGLSRDPNDNTGGEQRAVGVWGVSCSPEST